MDQSLALFTTALAVLARLSIALKDYVLGMWESLQREGISQPGASAAVRNNAVLEEDDSAYSPRNSAKVVYSLPLVDLPGALVDPSILSTPCRLRLVDASAFLDAAELRIVEYDDPGLSDALFDIGQSTVPPYAAVSYPWRDLQLDAGCVVASFSVAGAQHADPISMDVLRTACAAAREYGFDMLWLDRLCLLQNSKQDKVWQIQRMFRIYRHCSICLVFPGGLVRLARLDDETSWIYRAWTLQEAVAPGQAKLRLVIQLSYPSYRAYLEQRCQSESYSDTLRNRLLSRPTTDGQHGDFVEKVLEHGRSASCDMAKFLLELWSLDNRMRLEEPEIVHDVSKYPIRLLPPAEARMLDLAIELGGIRLWISAYTRSSSRPVDMVFSLMDLLGVQIEVKRFGENDRLRATVALLRVLMRHPSARATWLFIAPAMTPSRELSTLPQFPETSESGRAYISTPRGRLPASQAIPGGGTNFWRSDGAPGGEITDTGYFRFTTKGALMVTAQSESGSHPKSSDAESNDTETWAVVVGRFNNFNRNPETWKMQTYNPDKMARPKGLGELTVMLIEKHAEGLYHRIGMERQIDERKTAGWSWVQREFQVGGPGRGERRRFGVAPDGPVHVLEDTDEADESTMYLE